MQDILSKSGRATFKTRGNVTFYPSLIALFKCYCSDSLSPSLFLTHSLPLSVFVCVCVYVCFFCSKICRKIDNKQMLKLNR